MKTLRLFLNNRTEELPSSKAQSADLLHAYTKWAKETGKSMDCWTVDSLARAMRSLGFKTGRGRNGASAVQGIRLTL